MTKEKNAELREEFKQHWNAFQAAKKNLNDMYSYESFDKILDDFDKAVHEIKECLKIGIERKDDIEIDVSIATMKKIVAEYSSHYESPEK